jgi:hypothetical protein
VNITFIQQQTFGGSHFPPSLWDTAFVGESGPTYGQGPQSLGKRVVSFKLDANGALVSGPTTLAEYTGSGHGTVVGLAAGPDGLYFTELYKDLNAETPIDAGARVFRIRYVGQTAGDYDWDSDVDGNDFLQWQRTLGSSVNLAADGNHNRVVDGADLSAWKDNFGVQPEIAAAAHAASATEAPAGPMASSSATPTSSDRPTFSPRLADLAMSGAPATLLSAAGASRLARPPFRPAASFGTWGSAISGATRQDLPLLDRHSASDRDPFASSNNAPDTQATAAAFDELGEDWSSGADGASDDI